MFPSASSGNEGTNSTNQAKPTMAGTGTSTVVFPVTGGGTQAQGGTVKPFPFSTANTSSTKSIFSFNGAGSDTSNATKQEPGKTASVFTLNYNPASSTPTAVPPTPGSVFSDTAAKNSQNANPIAQPLFGAPKNAGAAGSSGFTFGQTSAPAPAPAAFSFGSFGTQKS